MPNSLWNAPIDKIEFADVVSFCAAQLKESISLDYKEKFSSTNAGKQIAKEVSALANTYGGLIIYGVSETEDRLPEANPEGKDLGERPRDRVIQACHANIFPPFVPEVSEFLPNQDKPGQGFLVIRVPASPAAPHSVEDGKRTYVRVADKSEPDDIHQSRFEAMLERRRTRLSTQKDRVTVGIGRLMGPLNIDVSPSPNPTGFLAVGIGPTIMDTPDHEFAKTAMQALAVRDDQLLSVSDGLYTFDESQGLGFLADDYGNIVCVKSGDHLSRVFNPEPYSAAHYSWLSDESEVHGILIQDALLPLVRTVNAASQSMFECGFFGEISVFVRADSLVGCPLYFQGRDQQIVAATLTDETIELGFAMSLSAMGPEGWNASHTAASKLLWAWGKHPQVDTRSFLDYAESCAFGSTDCSCSIPGRIMRKPRNHSLCRLCRERPPGNPELESAN